VVTGVGLLIALAVARALLLFSLHHSGYMTYVLRITGEYDNVEMVINIDEAT